MFKSYDLVGSVTIEPVAVLKIGLDDYEETLDALFKTHIRNTMKEFSECLSHVLVHCDRNDAARVHEHSAWLCEIVYKSTDPSEPRIHITTNIARPNDLDGNVILVRDPSINRTLWPQSFVEDYLQKHP